MADKKTTWQIDLQVRKQGLNQLKKQLDELKQASKMDLGIKINKSTLTQIERQAKKVESALTQAFNPKLNIYNIETFNKALNKSGTNIENIYKTFSKAGTVGQNAFRNLTNQLLNTNLQLRQSHEWLDKIATTLGNTLKWTAASAAIRGVTSSIQQAFGYVKSLDTSLNDIRIVTGKSADEMSRFAKEANEVSKSLGKTTTDYSKAALIYAQQGLSDAEVAERAKITLKTANVTGQSTDEVSEQLTAVWNGYKVNAEQAQIYIDRLAAVAATTASDLEELSTGMSKVASAAAAMGVGEDQLAAQLSTIISVTRQAPETVGTALTIQGIKVA